METTVETPCKVGLAKAFPAAAHRVPLIIRGRLFEESEREFGGQARDSRFVTADVNAHIAQLPLSSPSAMRELYDLRFDDIVDYLARLGDHLCFDENRYLQEAFELSLATSRLSMEILRHCYETMREVFARDLVREVAEQSLGIPYLEGWVEKPVGNGGVLRVRAFGARAVHIVAGNVPTVSAVSIMRNALTRSDAIIKTPSNDPLTAAAIARTMIDMAPDHPLTRHLSVAYWRGGDAEIEEALYQPRNVEKIVAWGGLASVRHIAKYIQPGIDLITLDPKLSSTIVGREAFRSEATMREVAEGIALDAGSFNQEGCLNARVVYVESGTDGPGVGRLNQLGELVWGALRVLPPHVSGPARSLDERLWDEVEALRNTSDWHKVIGGGREGAVIVSQESEPVDFAAILANRVVNLVPVDDLDIAVRAVNAYTQTIGIYPEELKDRLRDQLALQGAQRLVTLGYASTPVFSGPQDAMEPLRRMVRWIVDEHYESVHK